MPDLGPQSATTAASRKRGARKELSSTAGERTAASDAKILRELAALDKESARDVFIPVPIRARDGAGRGEFLIACWIVDEQFTNSDEGQFI